MKLVCILLLLPALLISQTDPTKRYVYASPVPGSSMNNPHTNVIIRYGDEIDPTSMSQTLLRVVGSASGLHTGMVKLTDDRKTITFKPALPFVPGETIAVECAGTLLTSHREKTGAFSFRFTISRGVQTLKRASSPASEGMGSRRLPVLHVRPDPPPLNRVHSTLPADFPTIRMLKNDNPRGEPIFLSSIVWWESETAPYLMILDRRGDPLFYRRVSEGWDFKTQPNGTLTYYDMSLGYFVGLDSAYQIVDQYMCGNGYSTNEHELRVLPNGHAYLLSYDPEIVGMDTVVAGGNPAALVVGLIIQEIDLNKDVVFQWRSWDHFKITDGTFDDLTGATIDWVHGNAIEIDQDGNLLLSSRNMDEVTKIDRATGEIIWRLGGKNNQFTLVNDPGRFEGQHDIRLLPNGHITLFDNGAYREYSRAVEFALDVEAKTATRVWEYRNTPDIFGWALGSTQRLPNGNTLIGWGSANPTLAEVTPDGAKVLEWDLPENIYSYRAFTGPWRTNAFVPAVDSIIFANTAVGDSVTYELTITNPTAYDITITSISHRTARFNVSTAGPLSLGHHSSEHIAISMTPTEFGSVSDTLELSSQDSTQGIFKRIPLRGSSPPPSMIASPAALEFGNVPLKSSKQLAVRFSNSSVNRLQIDSAYTTTPVFAVNRSHISIAAEDSILVTFSSTAYGAASDTLYLLNNSPVPMVKIPLAGSTPMPGIAFSVTSLDFGIVQKGDSSTRFLDIRNTSISPLTITQATVLSPVFKTLLAVPATVSGGDSVRLAIRFKPVSFGVLADTLIIVSDGGTAKIALKGTCPEPSVGIARDDGVMPLVYSLSQNYPNPFNPTTTIAFGIPEASSVRLTLFDVTGREVQTLVDERLSAGYYRFRWDAAGVSTGMYFYRMTALALQGVNTQAFDQVKKLLLVK